jgi:hypothetical protein
MSLVFGLLMMGALALMTGVEIRRYARAIRTADDFPYPRRRLTRRIAIAVTFSAVVGVMIGLVHPRLNIAPMVRLALFLLMCLWVLIGFVLLWRDLRETSQTAVDQASRLSEQAAEALRRALREKRDGPADPTSLRSQISNFKSQISRKPDDED